MTGSRAVGLKTVDADYGVRGEEIWTRSVKLVAVDAWLRKQIRPGVQINCKVYVRLLFRSMFRDPVN